MARLIDQVADILAEARNIRREIEAQVERCHRMRDRKATGIGVPVLYFYATIFNGTVGVFNSFPIFREGGTGSGLGPGFKQVPFSNKG